MLPSFLAKPFVAPLAIGVATLSLAGNAWLGILHWSDGRTITTLTTENTRLAGDLSTCQRGKAALEGVIKGQNIAVDGLKLAAEAAAANARAGQAAAEVTASAYDREAARLGQLPKLPAGANSCALASVLIRDTLAGEHSK